MGTIPFVVTKAELLRADRLSQAFRAAVRARMVLFLDGENWAEAARATGISRPAMYRHFSSTSAIQTKKIPMDDVIAIVAWLAGADGGPAFDEFYRLATEHVQ